MSDANTNPQFALGDVVNDALGVGITYNSAQVMDDKALLAKYGFQDEEVTFSMRDPVTGEVLREKEPCYELLADGFYGNGLHGTWYMEGATIVMPGFPNQHMKPLNRAAALNYCRWQESLPQNKVTIEIADMQEAAIILAKDPRVKEMAPSVAQMVTIKVAEGLKLKREGKDAMDLRAGDINRNFAPQSGGKAPPVLGAKMSDMSQIGPGATRAFAAITGPGANVRRAAPIGGPGR